MARSSSWSLGTIRWLTAGLLVVLMGGVLPPPASAATSSVVVVRSTATVRPQASDTIEGGLIYPDRTATLTAARNEFESFQIVVEAGDTAINGLQVNLVSPMAPTAATRRRIRARGRTGAGRPEVSIYRADVYHVNTGKESDHWEGGTGDWFDPLIPKVDRFYGETRSGAFPVNVPAGRRALVWIDVFVPQGQTVGTYTGTLRLTATSGLAGAPVDVTASVRVVNAQFPSIPTFGMVIPFYKTGDGHSTTACFAHNQDKPTPQLYCNNNEVVGSRLNALYVAAALDDRVTLSTPVYRQPNDIATDGDPAHSARALFRSFILPYIEGDNASQPFPTRLVGAALSHVSINWHCDAACAAAWADESAPGKSDFRDRLIYLPCDEPNNDPAKWTGCRNEVQDFAGYPGMEDVPPMITATPNDAAANGSLQLADILTPLSSYVANRACCNARFQGNQRDSQPYDDYLDGGNNQAGSPLNQLWIYTACDAYSCEDSDVSDGSPLYQGWPGYAIDQKGPQARILSWLAYYYRIEAPDGNGGTQAGNEYYWDAGWNLHAAWNGAGNGQFVFGGNGDGTLFYPGLPSIIGGTKDIPIESMRLKRIRDGHEDYEFLRLAAARGGRPFVNGVIAGIFGDRDHAMSTVPTTAQLEGARDTLIACAVQGDCGQPRADLVLGMNNSGAGRVVGETYAYSLAVLNDGPDAAQDVSLGATLPAGLRVWNVTQDIGACDDLATTLTSVTCAIDSLGSGDEVDLTVTVYAIAPGTKTIHGEVSSATDDPAPGNDSGNSVPVAVAGPTCTVAGTPGADAALDGTAANDVICGFAGIDVIHGKAGNDVIYAGKGNDQLFGEAGNDTLVGGPGDDTLDGGADTDTASLGDAQAKVGVNLLAQDSSFCLDGSACGVGFDALVNDTIENVVGSAYDDAIVGDNRDNTIIGLAGNDVINAYGGNDVLRGDAGDDTLIGNNGTDTVTYVTATAGVTVDLALTAKQNTGGAGGDTLDRVENATGSPHADTLRGTNAINVLSGLGGNDILDGRGAQDTLNGGADTDVSTYLSSTAGVTVDLATNTGDSFIGVENLNGSNHADVLKGTAGANVINGQGGGDEISGRAGGDVIHGNAGDDTLNGNEGNDSLFGDSGVDTLNGGIGAGDYCSVGADGGTKVPGTCELP